MEKLIFLIASFLGVSLYVFIIIAVSKLQSSGDPSADRSQRRIQEFYELIISGTSIMSFSCSYVILNHIYSLLPDQSSLFAKLWGNWKDFMLLLLICLSCVLNSVLDNLIIPLKTIDKSEKASVRMLGMFYAIIILVYLNFIGDESEYNPVMMYYLGLMIGRFVYFDASLSDFVDAVKSILAHIPLLALGLILTFSLSNYGFSAGYLLERNYYIVGVFYTQLFMLASVFILRHSHLPELILRTKDSHQTGNDESAPAPDAEEDAEDYEYTDEDALEDYGEYDDYEEDYDDYDEK
ncbi:MAG: hypothetical protein J5966_08730 [Lachnospiraceae bacterium]|nr:hypothetical protein [Lachnospiraceae bacterium]